MYLPLAFYGILKAGAVYVGIDSTHPQRRVDYLIEDSGARVLLRLNDDSAACPVANISECKAGTVDVVVEREDTACIIYTSGSTGEPKGAALRHESFLSVSD